MSNKPNIVIILADQLNSDALGVLRDGTSVTPQLDRLMARGVRFDQAYTPCPLCQPARAAFWSGLLPHQTGVLSNGRNFPVTPLAENIPTLGTLMSEAGYQAVHFGKCHDAGALRGFVCVTEQEQDVQPLAGWGINADTRRDRDTTEKAVAFLRQHRDPSPWLMVADLNNPHNICGWVGENQGVHDDKPILGPLPELPGNFEIHDIHERPLPVQFACCAHNRLAQTQGWTADNFRYYIAAYLHYVARMDAEVGLILQALEARHDADRTLVIFFSDHGDGMARHRMVTKHTTFYEETARVPWVFAGSGVTGKNRVLDKPLVSLMDLLPTLCEVAGATIPKGLWGRSLWPWVGGRDEGSPHDYVVSQWHTEWGFTIEPGRMIRSADYKYCHYLEGPGEELYNMISDPGEQTNLAHDPAYQNALHMHRQMMKEYLHQYRDDYLNLNWHVDARWRSHPPGYVHHHGPAAPMIATSNPHGTPC